MKSALVLKIAPNTWHNASHDKRELAAVRELGVRVLVMAKGDKTGVRETVDGFAVYRCNTRPLGPRIPAGLNRVAALFTWAHEARKLDADVISGHDLSGLLIGYLSNAFLPTRKKAALVYDSHEFELGNSIARGRLATLCVKWLEGFLMRRCAFSIMVNDSIADEVQRIHGLKTRPVVARNMAGYQRLDPAAIARRRAAFYGALGVSADTFILMYHGYLYPARGIENMLRAVARTRGTAAVVLGNDSDAAYVAGLHALCRDLGVTDRVLFCPAVPLEELWAYVGAASVGTVLLEPVVKNHYYTLPNKFFENIQALTPVIVSDFPEVGGLTKRYGIGLTVDPEDVGAIVAAVERMRDDKAFYAQCKANLTKAKEELCWEKEKKALQTAYAKLLEEIEEKKV